MTRKFRAFSPIELSKGQDELVLGEEESHHLGKVLRARNGVSVEILDGKGFLAQGEISEMDRRQSGLGYWKENRCPRQPPFFRIAVAMTKANRWEEIIRPLTEMGVGRITPLLTERTEVRMPSGKETEKLAKWRKLAIEACKQSGNPWLPEIDSPLKFGELLPDKENRSFIASIRLSFGKSLADFESPPSGALLIIGPEGGWTDGEEDWVFGERGRSLFFGAQRG